MKKILYLSYDGLTDPLGQSQVLPYLKGLSEKGYLFHVISCEKKKNVFEQKEKIEEIIKDSGITWHPISYTKNPAVISTLWDLWRMKRKAFSLHRKENFQIVHCRSYIASLIGLRMKKTFGLKFIFDMRGFWADERVEGNLWNLKNTIYKFIYNYFKKKETDFFSNADYTVSLTEKGKQIIHRWKHIPNQPIPIQVIPCCVNTEHFSKEKISQQQLLELKKKLGIQEKDFVLSYLGSIGTWYLLEEMLLFFKRLLQSKPDSKFLFITQESKENIFDGARKINLSSEKIIVQKSSYADVPALLPLSNASVFFIKKSFSKQASSPTKQAEVLSMGIPLICNCGIGDTDEIIQQGCGLLIKNFNDDEYDKIIFSLDKLLKIPPQNIRTIAIENFSLKKGVERYDSLCKNILKTN